METEEANRAPEATAVAKRDGFESGVAWSICGAAWGFFLSVLVLGLFGEFDHLNGFVVITVLAVAAWIWWLPMREARRRMRDRSP